MTNNCGRWPRRESPVDLLPWADAYIVKLFREAELLSEVCEPDWSRESGKAGLATPSNVVPLAGIASAESLILKPFRPSTARKRRTESVRSLAGCLG
jgi:hypothetical protein